MRHRTFLLLLLALAWAFPAQAQTTRTLVWDQPDVTLVEAQALVYRVAVDGAPAVPVPQTCTQAAALVSCRAPFVMGDGRHTVVLTVDNGFGTASATISGAPPSGPIHLSVVVTVTVGQ